MFGKGRISGSSRLGTEKRTSDGVFCGIVNIVLIKRDCRPAYGGEMTGCEARTGGSRVGKEGPASQTRLGSV